MYSALTYDVMKSYLTHDLCETRKFVMAIFHWKQGLLCDKTRSVWLRSTGFLYQTTKIWMGPN